MSDLLLRTLRGEETERRPVWLMRQAGRYLPEYKALRATYRFEDLLGSPELAARVTLLPLERFSLDAAIVFADLMSPVPSLGITVGFDPGPVLDTPLRTSKDIYSLREPEPDEIAPEVMATLRQVKQKLMGRNVVIGFSGTPLSVAAYLVEGRASKDFPHLRALAAGEPELFDALQSRLQRLLSRYIREQVQAGADVIQIFDSWAGLLAPEEWTKQVRPHLEALLQDVAWTGIPIILYFRAPHLVNEYCTLPCNALSIDWRVDLAGLRKTLGPERVLQGNIDPAVLVAGPEATLRATESLLCRMPPRGHIVNLGHGVHPATPPASVAALVERIHEEKIPE